MRVMKRKLHTPTPAAKVAFYGVAQEWLLKTISKSEYLARTREIWTDDRASCRKACCWRQVHDED
jgi:hypothetical protein